MAAQLYSYKSTQGMHGNSALAILIGIILSVIFFAIGYYYSSSLAVGTALFVVVLLIYLLISVKVLQEWKRAPILTLGKYKGTYGPGLFFIIPLIQSMPYKFDLRTFSTVFSAEKTLTQDNVGVDVEAIMFTRIENPENTALQVNDVDQSVSLAAQTALRDVIGKVNLSQMIVGRNEIASSVKTLIDQRVTPWGVNVISVEIRDVKIPDDLQDAMAKVAIASRERDARVILAESEKLAATNMVAAAKTYNSNVYAMQLRALNMLYEIGISGRNHLIFIPTESRGLGIPTPIGVLGIDKLVGMGDTGNIDGQKKDGNSVDAGTAAQKPSPPQPQQASAQQKNQQSAQQSKQKKKQQDTQTGNNAGNPEIPDETQGDPFNA
ncbi:FtsH protease regulator HflK [Candidatus Micrarchaeum sp.]|uniref:SPFH domain-containing protein n=1 Tax=Candidatus Micrarchaeum sp. TaxID=2282148 RepID=UPI0019320398|nr:SPFH domain-containing protein [Candidatus Micrarchaeum sp.]QRF74018.1 FtsH protease regulator HflK [Candidatus Micrarchaeum sp.]